VAELEAARNGLKEQVLRNELLKFRLAKLLRERFGASSEKLRDEIEQLELLLGELEEQVGEITPAAAEEPTATLPETETQRPSLPLRRRGPARRPLRASLPRDVVEHAAPCACPRCGGALRPLGEDVTEVLDYVPGSFRVTRHVRPKLSCRSCEGIAQAPAPSLPIRRGLANPEVGLRSGPPPSVQVGLGSGHSRSCLAPSRVGIINCARYLDGQQIGKVRQRVECPAQNAQSNS
jgi:hypothetical protein